MWIKSERIIELNRELAWTSCTPSPMQILADYAPMPKFVKKTTNAYSYGTRID